MNGFLARRGSHWLRARTTLVDCAAKEQLRELFEKQTDIVLKLRAFWTLYCIGAADEPFLRAQLRHPNEHVRTWAIRFLTDTWPLDTVMSQRPGLQSKSEIGNAASPLNPDRLLH